MPRQRNLTSRRLVRRALSALLVAPLLAWTGFAITLTGLTLSPSQVGVGGAANGTVTLDAAPSKGTISVQLSSHNPAIATVPSSVSFSSLTNQTSRSFTINPLAMGCSEIKAVLSGATKRALFKVEPPANQPGAPSVSFSSNTTLSGASVTGTISVAGGQAGPFKVSLASNSPAATVPLSVSITTTFNEGVYAGSATFPISTNASNPTCPVISATLNGVTGRKLLTVLPVPG
ncbi:MAG TPA: hypothetical protein VJ717_15900 [Gemmatimonadaceae bacterium]|nr:hypothetical protein [Gemmatimonadaceae bacterium]